MLIDWSMVNVGTILGLPVGPASQAGHGQARRLLLARGWGGAFVVVRERDIT